MNQLDSRDLSVENEELLVRCAQGDQQALRSLFIRHERPVYGLLYRMLSNHEDAEDALAIVFTKVWKAASRFKGKASFTTWLYRITANTAMDILRSRKTRPEVSIEETLISEAELLKHSANHFEDPEETVLKAEGNAVLAAAMAKLPEEERLLISLYHLQDLSYEEIAEITGITPKHLKVKVFRARQRLKKHYTTIEKEEKDGLRDSAAEPTGLQSPATEPR